jgi:hypothetical protein
MKILVAGDSFAACSYPGSDSDKDDFSWPGIMARKYNYEIENIAFGGTSLSYTYKYLNSFKEQFNKFNFIIVVVTNPGRIQYNNQFCRTLAKGEPRGSSYQTLKQTIELLKKNSKEDTEDYKRALAGKLFYKHFILNDDSFEHFLNYKLIKKIINIVPKEKLILFAAFNISGYKNLMYSNLIFYDILIHELTNIYSAYQKNEREELNYREIYKNKQNHLILENRELVADYVHQIISKNNSIPYDMFDYNKVVKIKPEDLSKYYNI